MDQRTLELYLYMSSIEPIIEWLEKEGVKTKKEALQKLASATRNNVYNVLGRGEGSLAGNANAIQRIVKHFESKENG